MKNKILFFVSVLFFIFCFIILLKGLNNKHTYIPNKISQNKIPYFKVDTLFIKGDISFEKIFTNSEFYILNIWSSWCYPCREEHPKLMELSKNPRLKLIGINYKDNNKNAKDFVDKMGNPYSIIIVDKDGTISIELGAYGVPETFIVNKNKEIIKKFIGPLNEENLKDIKKIIK